MSLAYKRHTVEQSQSAAKTPSRIHGGTGISLSLPTWPPLSTRAADKQIHFGARGVFYFSTHTPHPPSPLP